MYSWWRDVHWPDPWSHSQSATNNWHPRRPARPEWRKKDKNRACDKYWERRRWNKYWAGSWPDHPPWYREDPRRHWPSWGLGRGWDLPADTCYCSHPSKR